MENFSIEYYCDSNIHFKHAHKSRRVHKMTKIRTKTFDTIEKALSFFNECYFPITQIEELLASYDKMLNLEFNTRTIKRLSC